MKNSESNWISISDLMAGLLLIFIFLVIISIKQVQEKTSQYKELISEFNLVKTEIYLDLKNSFKDKEKEWGIVISKDLTVSFEENILFERDSKVITKEYINILEQFIPKYLDLINKERYKDKITQVSIEGHTANISNVHDTYLKTIELSQDRSREVLKFVLNHKSYLSFNDENKNKIRFWLNANGYGLNKALDENREYVYKSNEKISPISRRVEFKIITNDVDLLDKLGKIK